MKLAEQVLRKFSKAWESVRLFKALPTLFGFWKTPLNRDLPFYRGSTIAMDVAPELMGVGYIIGYRTSLIMVAGGLLSSFVIGPILAFAGQVSINFNLSWNINHP